MSLILDALRKSDGQRQRKASERLREGPGPARAVSNSAWLIIGAGVLLAAALVALVVGWQAPAPPAATHGSDAESMENNAAVTRAPVRALQAELAREPVPPVPKPAVPRGDTGTSAQAEATLAVPGLENLSQAARASLPALHVDVHAWAENPTERFVLINLRRYHEGDRLDEGPLVRRIQPDDVVLEYRGELFSLPRR